MRKSGLTGDEAYALSKRRKTTEDLGPLKKEISLIKEDTTALQKRQNVLVGSETGRLGERGEGAEGKECRHILAGQIFLGIS